MARVRSPAYPALSLPDAIDVIRKVHSAQQRTPEPREVVVRHMGYAGISGRSDKALSALIKYGFLEPYDKNRLRVSDAAISILYPDPEQRGSPAKELVAASRAPALFAEIFARWEIRPSDASLKNFLIQKGFNVNSVDQVARAFYETYDLVANFVDSNEPAGDTDDWDEGGEIVDIKDQAIPPLQQNFTLSEKTGHGAPPTSPGSPINVTKPIFDFETVTINTKIDNQEDLQELMLRLEKVLHLLPRKDPL